jgi:putative nucleotidyltransferase with HDIG domain
LPSSEGENKRSLKGYTRYDVESTDGEKLSPSGTEKLSPSDAEDRPTTLSSLLPEPALEVMEALEKAGHRAYLVGGCVRDLLLGREPKDLDVASSALPEEVKGLFRRAHPKGERFGTVTVLDFGEPVEVTTFRAEDGYADHRHPAEVRLGVTLEEDLARRDFTINAMALGRRGEIVDPFGGREDLRRGIIRCVGDPARRFAEDALRMLRACRLAAELGFALHPDTLSAIKEQAYLIDHVSPERIREEFLRLLLARDHKRGFDLLLETGLLGRVAPEIASLVGVEQGSHHLYDCYTHSLLTVVDKDIPSLALAELLHDLGKPETRSVTPDGRVRFHRHEVVGAEKAARLLERLRFPRRTAEEVSTLIRHHLVFTLRDAGIPLLARLVRADVAAHGCMPPERSQEVERVVRKLEEMASRAEPLTLADLAVNGRDVMAALGIPPGPRVGQILARLLEAVLEDPSLNTREKLLQLAKEI